MGILQGLFGRVQEEERRPLDIEENGRELYKEDIVGNIMGELERRRQEKIPYELQWTLNSNFLLGNQYCDIHPSGGRICQLDAPPGCVERETFNRIAPLIETRIANLKKIKYAMTVNPRTNEPDDYDKAEVSTAILRHKQTTSNFGARANTALHWNELCGNVFWISWWDRNAGNKVAAVEEVTLDTESGEVTKKERAAYEGDVDYGLVSSYEIFPESIYKQGISNQNSIIIEQVKSVKEIENLYGFKTDGREVDTFHLTPIGSGGGLGYESTVMQVGCHSIPDAEKVITYFEKPSLTRPEGRLAVIVGSELVFYDKMPYDTIPIVQVMCKEVPGHFFGKSVIEDLIPLQRAYNSQVNAIHEYNRRAAIGAYFVEKDSVDIDDFAENAAAPGAVIEVEKGADKPTPITTGTLPNDIWDAKESLENAMEYVAGVSQLMVVGSTPSGVTSGTAISQLQEIDNTRLAMTGDHHRNAVKEMAKIWLSIYKRFASSYRVMKYTGANGFGRVITWSKDTVNSYDVEFETENELIHSPDSQRDAFFTMLQAGMFTEADGSLPQRIKHKALEMSHIGQYEDLLTINELQIQSAVTENNLLESGVIPEIGKFDDHEIHMEEHKRYCLQMKFRRMKAKNPRLAELMEAHVEAHQAEMQKKAQAMMEMMQGGEGNV